MKLITFGEFYEKACEKLTHPQLVDLDPKHFYFEEQGMLFGLFALPEKSLVVVSMAVGQGFSAFWALKKFLKSKGVRYVGFLCREDGLGHRVTQRAKGVIENTGKKSVVGDGKYVIRCTIDLEACRG